MRFKINISIRAIPIVLETIENFIPLMEYSTELYFRKIQEILLEKIETKSDQNQNKKNKYKKYKISNYNTKKRYKTSR